MLKGGLCWLLAANKICFQVVAAWKERWALEQGFVLGAEQELRGGLVRGDCLRLPGDIHGERARWRCRGWRRMVHLDFFLNHPVLSIIRFFLPTYFLISFCIQNRLRGNHCLRSPSFCTVCTVCPSRKWRRWYEEAKSSSCYLRLFCSPWQKYWSIYAKAEKS